DCEVQRGLGVAGVDAQRGLEGALAPGELTLVMVDDAEHVVDLDEALVSLDQPREIALRLGELLLLEVAAAQREPLSQFFVHATSSEMKGPGCAVYPGSAWGSPNPTAWAAYGAG